MRLRRSDLVRRLLVFCMVVLAGTTLGDGPTTARAAGAPTAVRAVAMLITPFLSAQSQSPCNPATGKIQAACPVTPRLRYRLQHPVSGENANLTCRCQGPGRNLTITQRVNDGRVAHVETRWFYGAGSTSLTWVVLRQRGAWVVDDQYCTGEPSTTVYAVPLRRCPVFAPRLTFPCSRSSRTLVTCVLHGEGFAAHEQVTISYQVEVHMAEGTQITTCHRTDTTDKQGSFTRPPLGFMVDPIRLQYTVTVEVAGMHGERASIIVKR